VKKHVTIPLTQHVTFLGDMAARVGGLGCKRTQRRLTPLDLDQNLFHGCFNHVTQVALRKTISNYKEAKQAKKPLDSGCTQVFTTTTGLPCAHKIHEKKSLNLGLTKDDFHPHWHWDRYSI
jgi:hypothetical protein